MEFAVKKKIKSEAIHCHFRDLFRAWTRLWSPQPGPRLCSHLPSAPALFYESAGDQNRPPALQHKAHPGLLELDLTCLLAFLFFGPRKVKTSLTFVPVLRCLYTLSQERTTVLSLVGRGEGEG